MASIPILILNDVKALIAATAPRLTIKIRKSLELLEGDAGWLPVCLLIPNAQVNEDEGFEGALIREYIIQIAIIWAGNMQIDSDLEDMTAALSNIPKALNVTSLTTATTVFDSTVNFSPTYDAAAIPRMYDHSVIDVTYLSSELRN
jgi:hypothetical protein